MLHYSIMYTVLNIGRVLTKRPVSDVRQMNAEKI